MGKGNLIKVATFASHSKRNGNGDNVPGNGQERLSHLRRLSKETGLPQATLKDADVCCTDRCLDAALDLIQSINSSVDPCKDFYQFACGRWIANNPVPSTEAIYAKGTVIVNLVTNVTQEILNAKEDPKDALPINQAKRFHKDCMDVDAIEKAGLEPLKQFINGFGGWQLLNPGEWNATAFDWVKSTADAYRLAAQTPLINCYVFANRKNTLEQIIILDQPSFLIPRAVLIAPENYTSLITAYENLIVEVATELGSTQKEADLRKSAKAIIEFEIKLAKMSFGDEIRLDIERGYNLFKLNEFQNMTDNVDGGGGGYTIPWKKYLDQLFSSSGVIIGKEERLVVMEPEYFKSLITILKEEELKKTPTVANYIVWKVISGMESESTEALRNARFRFMKALTGITAPSSRKDTCATSADSWFGMALEVKFVELAFDKESKAEMERMVQDLRATFRTMLKEEDWMEEETKMKAIEKLDTMRSFMGYPSWLENKTAVEKYYEGVELGKGHSENSFKLTRCFQDRSLGALRQPTDREYWIYAPTAVNAYYFAELNSINFLAAMLQPPFFRFGAPKHQNYAAVGSIVGHEITHGFDNRGSQFDKDGSVYNWWDNKTKAEFQKKGLCMINQYSGYHLEQAGMNINGELTLTENIGDNGGLKESFRAYQKYVKGNGVKELSLPGLEAYSIEQLFFLGYANMYCESITKAGLTVKLLKDSHSPFEYRVNGPIRNSDEFAKAYSCPVDSAGMNPPKSEKCVVW